MEIKIEIDDKDFSKFTQKTAELGLDPLDTLELIITKSLNERNLKSSISKEDKPKNHTEELFIDFENKMKKYNILQSSIAHYLQTTQASISRALKSKKDNTLLYEQMTVLHDRLLVYSYIYQNSNKTAITFEEIECKNILPAHSFPFLKTLAIEVEYNLGSNFFISIFLKKICEFVNTKLFQKINFETIYSDIDEFYETIQELAYSSYFDVYNPDENY